MNNQKQEPRARDNGGSLELHSIFLTIQGEGPFTGHRAVFVRLAGCNLRCPGCDTEYTEGRQGIAAIHLLHKVRALALPPHLVVITGGEPLRQSIGPFVNLLRLDGYQVQIESNGMFAPDVELYFKDVTLVVSPKTNKISYDAYMGASAFKYVLDAKHVDPEDGLPTVALGHISGGRPARPRDGVPVYLSPMDELDPVSNLLNLKAVTQSCIKHGYIAGVQLHKLMEIP